MKKTRILLFAVIVTLSFSHSLIAIPRALAAECSEGSKFCPLAPIPGLTEETTSAVNAATLAGFLNNLYKYLIGLAAILAVIEIIWGGLEISTKDSVSRQSDGRSRIQNALFGLVLVLMPALVFTIINPSILNLQIGMESLKSAPPKTPGDAANGNVAIGQICSSNDQCITKYCDKTHEDTEQPRCANTPDESGNQCVQDSTEPGKTCPQDYTCAITATSDSKFVCTLDCYTVPDEYIDCTGPALTAWCPSVSPDYDECKMSSVGAGSPIAVCVNMNSHSTDPLCRVKKKGPTAVSQIQHDYVP